MPSPGPTWALSPSEWGARVDYDKWDDPYTPDDAIAFHHGGGSNYEAGRSPFSQRKEIDQLRAWEYYHLVIKKWRGLAYGWAVGNTGAAFRIRGWNTYGAHSGDVDADHISNNKEVIPFLFIGSGHWHDLSPAARETTRRLRVYCESVAGRPLWLYGHQELRGIETSCPGPKIMSYVKANRELEDEMDPRIPDYLVETLEDLHEGRRLANDGAGINHDNTRRKLADLFTYGIGGGLTLKQVFAALRRRLS